MRAHIVLGRIHILYYRYEQAKAEIEHAIAINPSDVRRLAGRGNILMSPGQPDAAIEALELAQRIDPELDADRSLRPRHGVLSETALRCGNRASASSICVDSESSRFGRVVFTAAYAQRQPARSATRVVSSDSPGGSDIDPPVFGAKFQNQADLEHLRDGSRKAGFLRCRGWPPNDWQMIASASERATGSHWP